MRVLLIFCHPVENSYNAALHRVAKAALERAGHVVDDCDLYAEAFDPAGAPWMRALDELGHTLKSENRGETVIQLEPAK